MSKSLLNARAATENALAALATYYPLGVRNILLEEVEASADGKEWLITLGFDVTRQREPRAIEKLLPSLHDFVEVERIYKTFHVEAATGQVTAMKIRQLA